MAGLADAAAGADAPAARAQRQRRRLTAELAEQDALELAQPQPNLPLEFQPRATAANHNRTRKAA